MLYHACEEWCKISIPWYFAGFIYAHLRHIYENTAYIRHLRHSWTPPSTIFCHDYACWVRVAWCDACLHSQGVWFCCGVWRRRTWGDGGLVRHLPAQPGCVGFAEACGSGAHGVTVAFWDTCLHSQGVWFCSGVRLWCTWGDGGLVRHLHAQPGCLVLQWRAAAVHMG